uniref:SAM dependent methyltransferase n=1 Tax=Pithovirus LCPAC201 TaxID=2506591 RepID=A0A481Z4Q2_9VIRU|nr:MAG: SAM dependent methyltransferase [Pithovirus LCPAC201]
MDISHKPTNSNKNTKISSDWTKTPALYPSIKSLDSNLETITPMKTNPPLSTGKKESRNFELFSSSPSLFDFPCASEGLLGPCEVQPFSQNKLTISSPPAKYFKEDYGSSLFSSSPPESLSGNMYKIISDDTSSPDTSPEKPPVKFRKPRVIDPACRRQLFGKSVEETGNNGDYVPPTNVFKWGNNPKTSEQVAILSKPPVARKQKQKQKLRKSQNDRLSVLSLLLEASGRSINKRFKCYLDVGCGNGEIFSTNMAFLNPRRGYCADLHNNHLPGFIKVIDNKIPLPNKSVDLITCHVAIHHFTNPELMINEMVRVIIPGGYLFIREHDVSPEEETNVTAYLDLLHMMELIRHRRPITKEIQSTFHRRYWSRDDMSQLLANVGFEEIGFQRYVKHLNPQRIYHALYNFCPSLIGDNDRETTRISKTVQYSVDRNNLVVWLRTKAKKTSGYTKRRLNAYDRSYYRWFRDTIRKKLGLGGHRLERIINQSIDDLDFYQQIFDIIHPDFDYSHQNHHSSAFAETVRRSENFRGRPRSRSSPDSKNNLPYPEEAKTGNDDLSSKLCLESSYPDLNRRFGKQPNNIDTTRGGWKIQQNRSGRNTRGRQRRGYRRTRSSRQFVFDQRPSRNRNEYFTTHGH